MQTRAILLTIGLVLAGTPAAAQPLRGFAVTGVTTDANGQHFPTVGGGVVVDLGTPWVSAGGQGETFFSWPYFAGRGTAFGQGNFRLSDKARALALGGVGFGEDGGPMFGGGVEVRPWGGRFGFRFTVEDYVTRGQTYNCNIFGPSGCEATGNKIFNRVAIRGGVTF
jgi:hypothetical protein